MPAIRSRRPVPKAATSCGKSCKSSRICGVSDVGQYAGGSRRFGARGDVTLHSRSLFLVAAMVLAAAALPASSQDWPEFRGPGGQGVSTERDVPLEWSESRNIAWKTPVPGLGWSSPVVVGGRVWITTATGDRDLSLRALAFDVETGREVVNTEVFRVRGAASDQPQEQSCFTLADRRRGPRLCALRRPGHRRADDGRRGRVEGALQLRVPARCGWLAGAARRSADPELRRRRHGVRRCTR